MTRRRAIGAGFLAGLVAGLMMTMTMLLLAWLFGVATPLVVLGDRLSVFIPADAFLSLMGRVGGYNNLKQLGVGSVIIGQLLVGSLGGIIYGRIGFNGWVGLRLRLLLKKPLLEKQNGDHANGDRRISNIEDRRKERKSLPSPNRYPIW